MSYSTRRSQGFGQQQQNVGSIGQRRPIPSNNFVSGGQLTPQKGGVQQQSPQQQQRTNQNTGIQFRNQQQQQQQQQQQTPNKQQQTPVNKPPQHQAPVPKQQPPLPKQQPPLPKQPQPSPLPKQQPAVAKQELSTPPQQVVQQQQQQQQEQNVQQQQPMEQQIPMQMQTVDDKSDLENGGDAMETGEVKRKPFWTRTGNKISKREKMRRRNIRLSKMLQPKNAVMILNELVKNTTYTVDELPIKKDGNQFKATVLVEELEHVGYGRSKIHAKNSAAEMALRHFIKNNKMTEVKKEEDGNEKMDISEDESSQPLPWQHVASFALFKLFCSWGEDPNLAQSQLNLNSSGNERQHENRPAKKMPANPETINPLMLVNQMLPQAQFEEIGKTGNPPNVIFSYKCNVDDQSFLGTGPNKKAAKKMAAFGACHKVLGIVYPTDVYVPIY